MAVKVFDNGLKLGRVLTPPDAEPKFKFASYFDLNALPTIPADVGHENLVPNYPMFLNDQLGDCVIAGSQHQLQIYHAESNTPINLTDQSALANYEVWGNYNPNDPSTDGGVDMALAAQLWRTQGLLDADKQYHKIAAYVSLKPGNLNQLKASVYLFSAVGIGIQFPNYAMDRFQKGQIWDVAGPGEDTTVEGGHYIPAVAVRNGNIYVVTWGKVIQMTPTFFQEYCDIAIVHFSQEMLLKGVTLDGFNTDALTADLRSLTRLA